MPDIFDDFNKILKKELVPIVAKYFKSPNNKINENINEFFNDTKILLTDIFDQLSKNKDNSTQKSSPDIENITDIESSFDEEYDELLQRLAVIEENMIQIEKILKVKN
mgnify:FL=1|tara:strand:- start:413 stop:736 length:324 start_codon:yes stop_codon:yes gene_type:complete